MQISLTPYIEQLVEIAKTGVTLDPVYTLKGVRGMIAELQNNPGRFAGKRILYHHTGTCVIDSVML